MTTPSNATPHASPNASPAVLVVDDESHIQHVVSLKLRNAGIRVITADDGEEALELVRRERPDLVITDLQMPYMNGLELCEAMHNDPATAHIPALMLTARGFSLPAQALGRTSIVEVFSKPFSPKEILTCVQRLLDPKRRDEPEPVLLKPPA